MTPTRRVLVVVTLAALLTLALAAVALAAGAAPRPSAEAQTAGRWALLIAAGALLIGLPLALFLLGALWWALSLGKQKFPGSVIAPILQSAIVGHDKRVSTSKTVAVVWTYTVAAALLSLVIAKWMGHPFALQHQIHKNGLQPEYALLMGGPLGAAILAKGIVSSQVSQGKVSKPQADQTDVTHLVSGDDGSTDLGDLQYVLFNAVALIFFYGEFINAPALGLPTIPDVLLGLTSVSAVGYVGKKVLTTQTPTITKIAPAAAAPGDSVTIYGSGLYDPDDVSEKPVVTFRPVKPPHSHSVKADEVDPCGASNEGLLLDVKVPAGLNSGPHVVAVRSATNQRATWAKKFVVESR